MVECIDWLINWQSSWSLGKVFVAGFSMTCPVRFIEVDVGLTRPFNRGQFGVDGDEDGQMIAGQ